MNGAKHTQQRRLLITAFHKKRVDALNTALIACTEDYLARWQLGQRLDLVREMFALSLRLAITGQLGFAGLTDPALFEVLDLTIANVSLPSITSNLGAAPSQGSWIITSYAVANAIGVRVPFLPITPDRVLAALKGGNNATV